jgi:hypothetical protein
MRNQLTQWSTFHFLCRDCKNRQHLDHNLNNHVCHCRSRCKDSVYLKPVEEMFDAIKDVNYFFLASARIFSRLGDPVSNSLRKRHIKNTDQEENADPRKDCICRSECLIVNVKAEISTAKNPDTH